MVRDLEYCGYEHSDRAITVSYPVAEDLARHGWDSRKIDFCWNGIDPEQYNPHKVSKEKISEMRARHGIKDDKVMILFVGRLINCQKHREPRQGDATHLRGSP